MKPVKQQSSIEQKTKQNKTKPAIFFKKYIQSHQPVSQTTNKSSHTHITLMERGK